MKKLITLFLSISLILFGFSFVSAVEESEEVNENQSDIEESNVKIPKANAGADIEQLSGSKVIFKAITNNNDSKTQYEWDFDDGGFGDGEKSEHLYEYAGDYNVTLKAKNEAGEDTDEMMVKVYDDSIILITDKSISNEELQPIKKAASRERVYLFDVRNDKSAPDYIVEGTLTDYLLENSEIVKNSSAIVVWTSGNLGLNVLSKFAQKAEDLEGIDINSKAVINITEGGFTSVARYAQSTFDVLNPKYILLTKKSAIDYVIESKKADEILESVRESGISHNLISFYSERGIKDLGITNFMSYTINYLINRGVSTDNIILMLMLPIIATIIAFTRQFLGIKTFGIYTPTIITLSFIATGLKYGLTIFLVILTVATLIRLLFRKFRLLYLPRMAMMLTIVAFTILAMFVIGAATNRTGIIGLSILPILVLIILVEKFIAIQMEKGPRTAIMLSLETILVSVACYYVVSWNVLTTFILAYPEALLLTFVINILMGKWVGLRISEYIRFRAIKKDSSQNKKK
ncbi:MAG: PKD domain-containing protein [Parcubacteria group bacterium]|nr:PKD domain-containing protein [Parcubacteria group bacterium]